MTQAQISQLQSALYRTKFDLRIEGFLTLHDLHVSAVSRLKALKAS
jgi:hypothetical protein